MVIFFQLVIKVATPVLEQPTKTATVTARMVSMIKKGHVRPAIKAANLVLRAAPKTVVETVRRVTLITMGLVTVI